MKSSEHREWGVIVALIAVAIAFAFYTFSDKTVIKIIEFISQ